MTKSDKEKRRKHKRSKHGASPEYKLLTYCALGQYNKLRKLLQKHPTVDLEFFDPHGNTALHESDHAPNVEAQNASGVSIQQLAADALGASSDADSGAEPAAKRHKQAQHVPNESQAETDSSEDEEAEWQARLREEAGPELRGGDEDDWDSYGGFFPQPNIGPSSMEDEDAYARRIWQEMEKRRRQQTDGAAAARSYFAAQQEAETLRQKAEFDAAQRSRQILEEEKAKDRAWREAVLKGDLGSRRAKYEARWHVFATAAKDKQVCFIDVPWLVDDIDQDKTELTDFVLYGAVTADEQRRRSRAELMRWHPDKFIAKFGARLLATDRTRILDKVNTISQLLNSIGSSLA